jgi:hypothetical protein
MKDKVIVPSSNLNQLIRTMAVAIFCSAVLLAAAEKTVAQSSAIDTPKSPAAPSPKSVTTVAPAPIKVGPLVLSGSLRLRSETWNWFDTDRADGNYTFGAAVLRLALGQNKEKVEWLVEGEFPWLIKLPVDAIAPAPQGQLGLGASYFGASGRRDTAVIFKQGFVRFKGLPGDQASSLKLGRFEFNDGTEITPSDPALATVKRDHISQRLIGAFGFTHIGRSFDGLHYTRNFRAGNLTFVGARPTVGVFQLDGNRELDVDFYYGSFTKPLKHKAGESEARTFVLHYHDGRRLLKTDNRIEAARRIDNENIRFTTLGGHYIGVYQAGPGKADLLLWGAGQFGSWGTLDHRAAAVAIEAGYQPAKFAQKLKPWVRGGYFRSTGDGDPTDGTHGTFFQILPTPRIYARLPFYNLMNNEDIFGQLRIRPHAKINLRFDAHHLRVSSSKDLWYVGGGAFQKNTFGYVGRPSNGRKNLGWLLDVSADLAITPKTAFTFYFGSVRGGGVQSAIYPLGNNAFYSYFELTRKL